MAVSHAIVLRAACLELTMMSLIRTLVLCTGFLLASHAGVASNTFEIVLKPSDLLRQGNAYIEAGEIEKAKVSLTRAIKSNLTSRQLANAHNSLCVAFIKDESWQKAMTHCNAAIKIVPTNWRFHNNKGNIYFGLRRFDLAMKNYERGLRIAPKSTTLATNIEMLENYVQARNISLTRDDNPT